MTDRSSASPPSRPGRGTLYLRVAVDVVSVLLAFLIAYRLYVAAVGAGVLTRHAPSPEQYLLLAILFGVAVVGFGDLAGSFGPGTSVLQYREMRGAVRGVWLSAAFLFAALFVLKAGDEFSRLVLAGAVLLTLLMVVASRRAIAPLLRTVERSSGQARRTAIIGAGDTGFLLMKKIVLAPASSLELAGFVDDFRPRGSKVCCQLRQGEPDPFEAVVLGRTWELVDVVRDHKIDIVLVALSDVGESVADEIIQQADRLGVGVGLVPRLGAVRADQLQLEDLAAIPILARSSPRSGRLRDVIKRGLDLILAAGTLLLTAPLFLVIWLAVRIDSPGPVLFRQVRIGKEGRPFVILKFRTMRTDAEPFALSPTADNDRRVTQVGRWLRAFGLDELPQLINVLAGDMSIVGPRPEMPFLVEGYTQLQRERLIAKPGITGLWQLSPDRDARIHDNLEYDIFYVRQQSLLLDLLILLETVVFTASIGVRRLIGWNRRRLRRRRVALTGATEPGAGAATEPFIIVALDQRESDATSVRWESCFSAVRSTAVDGAVKILMAPTNVAAAARLLDQTPPVRLERGNGSVADFGADSTGEEPRDGGRESRLEIVPYRGPSELARWLSQASVVVTDLEHVRAHVVATSKTVVYFDPQGNVRMKHGTDSAGGDGRSERLAGMLKTGAMRSGGKKASGP